MFKPNVRYTGAALAYSLGGIFGGALAPIIATNITATYGSHAIGWYIAGMAAVSIVSVAILHGRMPKSFEQDGAHENTHRVGKPAAAAAE